MCTGIIQNQYPVGLYFQMRDIHQISGAIDPVMTQMDDFWESRNRALKPRNYTLLV